jgi:hypothetical protein
VKVGRKWMITERELHRYAKEMEQDNSPGKRKEQKGR